MDKFLRASLCGFLLVFLWLTASAGQTPGADRLAYALSGGRVIVSPGRVIDPGVVVIRGGVIEAVGPVATTPIPADARVIDVQGKVIHAAFIDPHVSTDRLAGKGPKRPKDDEAEKPSTERTRSRVIRARGYGQAEAAVREVSGKTESSKQ
jgi:imidazolonepropionase-like amidohydrolase